MALRKKLIDGAIFKGKDKAIVRGTTSKQINNQPLGKGTASATSQDPSVGTQPPQQQEDQLFQMLHEMKKQIKKQQRKSGHEREQIILDYENILREQKGLKQLNQQLQAQVVTL